MEPPATVRVGGKASGGSFNGKRLRKLQLERATSTVGVHREASQLDSFRRWNSMKEFDSITPLGTMYGASRRPKHPEEPFLYVLPEPKKIIDNDLVPESNQGEEKEKWDLAYPHGMPRWGPRLVTPASFIGSPLAQSTKTEPRCSPTKDLKTKSESNRKKRSRQTDVVNKAETQSKMAAARAIQHIAASSPGSLPKLTTKKMVETGLGARLFGRPSLLQSARVRQARVMHAGDRNLQTRSLEDPFLRPPQTGAARSVKSFEFLQSRAPPEVETVESNSVDTESAGPDRATNQRKKDDDGDDNDGGSLSVDDSVSGLVSAGEESVDAKIPVSPAEVFTAATMKKTQTVAGCLGSHLLGTKRSTPSLLRSARLQQASVMQGTVSRHSNTGMRTVESNSVDMESSGPDCATNQRKKDDDGDDNDDGSLSIDDSVSGLVSAGDDSVNAKIPVSPAEVFTAATMKKTPTAAGCLGSHLLGTNRSTPSLLQSARMQQASVMQGTVSRQSNTAMRTESETFVLLVDNEDQDDASVSIYDSASCSPKSQDPIVDVEADSQSWSMRTSSAEISIDETIGTCTGSINVIESVSKEVCTPHSIPTMILSEVDPESSSRHSDYSSLALNSGKGISKGGEEDEDEFFDAIDRMRDRPFDAKRCRELLKLRNRYLEEEERRKVLSPEAATRLSSIPLLSRAADEITLLELATRGKWLDLTPSTPKYTEPPPPSHFSAAYARQRWRQEPHLASMPDDGPSIQPIALVAPASISKPAITRNVPWHVATLVESTDDPKDGDNVVDWGMDQSSFIGHTTVPSFRSRLRRLFVRCLYFILLLLWAAMAALRLRDILTSETTSMFQPNGKIVKAVSVEELQFPNMSSLEIMPGTTLSVWTEKLILFFDHPLAESALVAADKEEFAPLTSQKCLPNISNTTKLWDATDLFKPVESEEIDVSNAQNDWTSIIENTMQDQSFYDDEVNVSYTKSKSQADINLEAGPSDKETASYHAREATQKVPLSSSAPFATSESPSDLNLEAGLLDQEIANIEEAAHKLPFLKSFNTSKNQIESPPDINPEAGQLYNEIASFHNDVLTQKLPFLKSSDDAYTTSESPPDLNHEAGQLTKEIESLHTEEAKPKVPLLKSLGDMLRSHGQKLQEQRRKRRQVLHL